MNTINNGDTGSAIRGVLNQIINSLQLIVDLAAGAGISIDLSATPNLTAVNLTGAGAKTLNKIDGITQGSKFAVRPAAGLTLTINDKIAIGSGNLKLNAPQKVIDGTNGGYIEFQLIGTDLYEVGFNDQYNS